MLFYNLDPSQSNSWRCLLQNSEPVHAVKNVETCVPPAETVDRDLPMCCKGCCSNRISLSNSLIFSHLAPSASSFVGVVDFSETQLSVITRLQVLCILLLALASSLCLLISPSFLVSDPSLFLSLNGKYDRHFWKAKLLLVYSWIRITEEICFSSAQ